MPRARLRFALLACSVGLGSACGPFVILDDGSSDESAESTDSADTTTATTTGASTVTTTTSAPTTTPPTMDVTTDEPREPGTCAPACAGPADCATSGLDPADYPCIDGFCEYVGELATCDPASCDDLMIGICTTVDGVSQCATPCNDDSMCLPGFTVCTGTDDAGNPICEAIPCYGAVEGEACIIDGLGQFGVCIEGECRCNDDSQCTFEGFGCNT